MGEFRSGELKNIGDLIGQRTIVLQGADAFTEKGFTQVPNAILRSKKLSMGAKLTYAALISYAWSNDFCFPGQDTLAEDMGSGRRSVVRYIDELEKRELIAIKRQGLGKVNIYTLRAKVKPKR